MTGDLSAGSARFNGSDCSTGPSRRDHTLLGAEQHRDLDDLHGRHDTVASSFLSPFRTALRGDAQLTHLERHRLIRGLYKHTDIDGNLVRHGLRIDEVQWLKR